MLRGLGVICVSVLTDVQKVLENITAVTQARIPAMEQSWPGHSNCGYQAEAWLGDQGSPVGSPDRQAEYPALCASSCAQEPGEPENLQESWKGSAAGKSCDIPGNQGKLQIGCWK